MTKRIYTDPSIASSEITPESVFLNRRAFIKASSGTAASALGLSTVIERCGTVGADLQD